MKMTLENTLADTIFHGAVGATAACAANLLFYGRNVLWLKVLIPVGTSFTAAAICGGGIYAIYRVSVYIFIKLINPTFLNLNKEQNLENQDRSSFNILSMVTVVPITLSYLSGTAPIAAATFMVAGALANLVLELDRDPPVRPHSSVSVSPAPSAPPAIEDSTDPDSTKP